MIDFLPVQTLKGARCCIERILDSCQSITGNNFRSRRCSISERLKSGGHVGNIKRFQRTSGSDKIGK